MLLQGQSAHSVAAETGVPVRTLQYWKAQEKIAPMADDASRVAVGRLLVDNVKAGLAATHEILQLFQDYEWLRKQNAAELATSFGIIADKQIRLIEAMIPTPAEGEDDS